jgi:hypothetical protein
VIRFLTLAIRIFALTIALAGLVAASISSATKPPIPAGPPVAASQRVPAIQ